MMKNLMLMIVICFSINIGAMNPDIESRMRTPITVPKKSELKNNLCNAGFSSFISISHILKDLNYDDNKERQLLPIDIIKILDKNIDGYNNFSHNRYRNSDWLWLEDKDRQEILQCIFSESAMYAVVCKYEAHKKAKL
jgi:hypothetical protein